MKNKWIQKAAGIFAFAAMLLLGASSCTIEDQVDLNAPSVDAIEADATISELNNIVAGMLSGMRNNLNTYLDDCGIVGRDYYRFSSADPRFTSDIPGVGEAVLDNNTFYIVNPWADAHRVIRTGWVLRHAIENTSAPLTAEQKLGYIGFAKTIQAYEMILVSNLTYSQGIRIDVEDPDNLGPFVSYDAALDAINTLLDEAYTDLTSAGDAFVMTLSSGFVGFDSPATFAQFNRAIKARASAYAQDWNGTLDALSNSFYNINGDLNTGCYVAYSTASGDIPNNLFISLPNQPTNARVALNFWVDDAEAGDLRLSKVAARSETAVSGVLSSDYDVALWSSQDDNVSIVRNEELILLAAEAKIQTGDLAGATADLNVIRQAAGLADYSGAQTQEALTDEMLKQRRYSLFGEGHRWVDMRRYGLLGEIATQNEDEDVWLEFPVPAAEGL
jgi:hypothetical protein